jgi:hypothetical protein
MRHGFALMALLVPLAGCVVPPGGPGYGYAQPGYPAAEYGYPGYAYNNGSPSMYVEGASVPLIFYGGGWGYWDNGRHWHRAPEGIGRHLEERHPGGVGYRPWGGGGFGRSEGFRPEAPRAGGYQPGGNPWANRGGGQPQGGGFHPQAQGGGFRQQPTPQVQRAAVPASRPAPPERHRDDEHHR